MKLPKLPTGIQVHGDSLRIDFYLHGTRCRESLGLSPTKQNIKHAEQLRGRILHEIATGEFDYSKHFPDSKIARERGWITPDADQTIEAGILAWLDEKTQSGRVGKACLRKYSQAINARIIPEFGKRKVTDLTRRELRHWVNRLHQEISGKTIANYLVPLRLYLGQCVEDGVIAANPLTDFRLPKIETREVEPFTDDELRSILDQCDPVYRNLFQFWAATGLRTSELLALRWEDIDLEATPEFPLGSIWVNRARVKHDGDKGTKTKAGTRRVRLFAPAREALDAQRHRTFFKQAEVFFNPRTNKPFVDDNCIRERAWKRALKAAGVEYRSPYQLRHTYASVLLSAGESPSWIAGQMGHTDAQTVLKHYARLVSKFSPDAGERGAAAFESISKTLQSEVA
jgi:integrase